MVQTARLSALLFATLLATVAMTGLPEAPSADGEPPELETRAVDLIQSDGLEFKDLNKNGQLDPYEDWRRSPQERARDLASRMSIDQIAGLMLFSNHQSIPAAADGFGAGTYDGQPFPESNAAPSALTDQQRAFVHEDHLRNVLITSVESPSVAARWSNNIQELAEKTPLGIPVNVASDPRHGATADAEFNAGAGGDISRWPENIGLAATFDPALVNQFGTIASKEYRKLGITTALSPQIDLATDPRWSRVNGTFGGDAQLSADMAAAYVNGFQTSTGDAELTHGWGFESVNTMIKHWPGGGAEEGGRDGHYDYGKYTVYPGDNFETHLVPFRAALNLDGPTGSASAVMPYYTIPYNQDPWGLNVGSAYSSYMINDLLRSSLGFDGVVSTDWGITEDRGPRGGWGGGRPWGVEDIEIGEAVRAVTPEDTEERDAAARLIKRHYMLLMAGVDQFGGENEPWPITAAYKLGVKRVGEPLMRARFERSAMRLLENMFRTGLFEDPYLDPNATKETVGAPEYMEAGYDAQLKSIVMLKNGPSSDNNVLPLSEETKVYIPKAFRTNADAFFPPSEIEESWYNPVPDPLVNRYVDRVDSPDDADAAIVFADGPIGGRGNDPEAPLSKYTPISLQYRPYTAKETHTVTGRSYEGRTVETANEEVLDQILKTKTAMRDKPVIVVLNLENPAVVNEFEHRVDGLLVHFGISNQALFDVMSGRTEPSGLLPFQMPAGMETVETQLEDVGRDMDPHVDEAGHAYDFAFGLDWAGQITDERYEKYAPRDKTADPKAPADRPDAQN